MKTALRISAFFLIFIQSAFAWNSFGHMTVAAIAYGHLTPASKARVAQLLKLNPNYADWIADVPESDRDEIAFLKAATWPDYIKSAQGYQDDGEQPKGSKASQNIGYDDKLMHRYWHYIDLPFSPDNTPLIQPQSPNAKTQIDTFRKTLADTHAADALKSYDLVWLLHLVGDVHQPLHATSRFTQDQPQGDRGGNAVALCEQPCRNELHAFWDDVLGTETDPNKAATYAGKVSAPAQSKAAISDESKWINESFEVAKKSVYVDPIGVGVGVGPYALDKSYRTTARNVAKKRVALAGVRLANLINNEIK
jgi:hypothetical protein